MRSKRADHQRGPEAQEHERWAKLKQTSGGNLVVMDSGELIGSLIAAHLVDEYLLIVHPIVLGHRAEALP